jgi:acyl carrier protein
MSERTTAAGDLVAIALAWVEAHRLPDADPALVVSPATDLLVSGVLDSLAFVELVSHLEEQSGRSPDLLSMEPEEFATLEGLCRAFDV